MSALRTFHHPYQPYDIQLTFMNALYDCIEQGQVGIFESPTGTFCHGKSLSIICGSLKWLRDHERTLLEEQPGFKHTESEPDWVLEHSTKERRSAMLQNKIDLEARLTMIRAKELRQKQRYEDGKSYQKRIKIESDHNLSIIADLEASYMLDDYDSDDERTQPKLEKEILWDGGLSAASTTLLDKLGMIAKQDSKQEDLENTDEFANEVRRVKMPPAMTEKVEGIKEPNMETSLPKETKYLSLGSRKNLCINPKVSKLVSATAINERCLELQKSSTSPDHKCIFLPDKETESLVNEFRDHALATIRDIEDLGILGKRLGVCPYYASRAAIKPSEIVTLPYPLLLQKSAREALGISLKGHIVIIDEAHNLMDAISNIHSTIVNLAQLKQCRAQIGLYLQRFSNKLKGKNRVYVTQIVRLIDSLVRFLENTVTDNKLTDGTVSTSALLSGKGVDQINLYKLDRYLRESKLARKVDGYISHAEKALKTTSEVHTSTTPILTHVQNFLQSLTNPTAEGRFFFSKAEGNNVFLRYMLLDPAHHFREIVEDARAVILAGGTMSPMDDYNHHLLPYVQPTRLKTLSCGHVIPVENLIAWPLTNGPNNLVFDFTYEKRNLPAMIDELGESIIRLCQVIPDGLVIFFPSYAYLEQVILRWKVASGRHHNTWDKLSGHKAIFREAKDGLGVEEVLREYSLSIETGKGALLLSVVGGKMSEGINFSDRLGRGVIIVGMPFPNIQSAEWRAKLEYVEHTIIRKGGSASDSKKAAREFYENACMRAVNQSIGRAIRHQKDYAAIIMLDRRYDSPRIRGKLPLWIQEGFVKDAGSKVFTDLISTLRKFFQVDRTC